MTLVLANSDNLAPVSLTIVALGLLAKPREERLADEGSVMPHRAVAGGSKTSLLLTLHDEDTSQHVSDHPKRQGMERREGTGSEERGGIAMAVTAQRAPDGGAGVG